MLRLHPKQPPRRGHGSLGVAKTAQLRTNAYAREARFQRLYAQYTAEQESRRAARPAVAQAVPEALVAIRAEVAVNVLLALGHDFVNRRGILHPVDREILPERRRAHLKHAAPERAHIVQRARNVPAQRPRLHDVAAHEAGIAPRAVLRQPFGIDRLRVRRARYGQNCRRGLAFGWLRAIPSHAARRLRAGFRQRLLAEHGQHARRVVQRQLQKPLHALVRSRLVPAGRPVEELPGHLLASCLVHQEHQLLRQSRKVFPLLFEIGFVAGVQIPVMIDDHPPQRVARHVVHPPGYRRVRFQEIERLRNHILTAEEIQNRQHLCVHIAHPHKAVALDAVPQAALHAQMRGSRCGFKDAVHKRVVAFKASQLRELSFNLHALRRVQLQTALVLQLNIRKAEAGLVALARAQRAQRVHAVALGMVVARALPAQRRQRLGRGLAEAHAHVHRLDGAVHHFRGDAQRAVKLRAEVEQHSGMRARPTRECTALVLSQIRLALLVLQQCLRVFHASPRLHHAHGQNPPADAFVILGCVSHVFPPQG